MLFSQVFAILIVFYLNFGLKLFARSGYYPGQIEEKIRAKAFLHHLKINYIHFK